MHIEITPEALLTQLDYPVNEHTLSQMKRIMANTENFDNFSKHLLSLKDSVSHYNGTIAMSNSHDYLKIKCEESSPSETIEAFDETVAKWSEKYKVQIRKVEGKPTYYILGQK
jgi:hypothetical protein